MVDYTLVGVDDNAFAIIGYVKKVMKKEGHSQEDIDAYMNDAQSKDYNHLVSISVDKLHEINAKKRREIGLSYELL